MVRFLNRLHHLIQRTEFVWALVAAIGLAGLYLCEVYAVEIPAVRYISGAMVLIPGVLALLRILLPLTLKAVRRDQRVVGDVFQTMSAFRRANWMGEFFKDHIHFKAGLIEVHRELPASGFVRWVENEQDLRDVSRLNATAFDRSIWADSAEQKFERNLAMWKRNAKSFLIVDRVRDEALWKKPGEEEREAVFYSCVFPMTEQGYRQYLIEAVAGDCGFRDHWIAGPGDRAHSVLLFAIARDRSQKAGDKPSETTTTPFYLQALAYHLQEIIRSDFPDRAATLYFQTASKAIAKMATNTTFDRSKLVTDDDETVYQTEVRLAFE